MKGISNLLYNIISIQFMSPHKDVFYRKIIINGIAFLFLVSGCIFGIRAIYHYLEPQWGEIYALAILCGLLLSLSLSLFMIQRLMKPVHYPALDFIKYIEKSFKEIPVNDFVKKIIPLVPFKPIIAILAIVCVAKIILSYKKP